jgi:hypothetical protein
VIRDSNPSGNKSFIFFLCKSLERRLGPPRLLFSMYRGSFLDLEGRGRDVATHLHLASRLRINGDILTLNLLRAVRFN